MILEFDDIIRGHLRFDSNTGTRIEDVLDKIKARYREELGERDDRFYNTLPDHDDFNARGKPKRSRFAR